MESVLSAEVTEAARLPETPEACAVWLITQRRLANPGVHTRERRLSEPHVPDLLASSPVPPTASLQLPTARHRAADAADRALLALILAM